MNMKKPLAVAVILLFIGVAFAPSIIGTISTIQMQNEGIQSRVYDFTDGNPHKAYKYTTFLLPRIAYLFPPSIHIRWEKEFDEYLEYPKLHYLDFNYTETSTSLFKKYIFHHFRFKLDGEADDIGNLEVYWFGKAAEDELIELYFWEYLSENKRFGFWILLDKKQSQGLPITISTGVHKDNVEHSLSEDNYFDICIVAEASSRFSTCTLYTDYVKIIIEEETYDIDGGSDNPVKRNCHEGFGGYVK